MEGGLPSVTGYRNKGMQPNVKPAAAAAPVSTGYVSEVLPSTFCEPDVLSEYIPFIRDCFVSLLGSSAQDSVTILRYRGL